jgi:hypothetical protein
MAVKHARIKTTLGSGSVVEVSLPGATYLVNHPKILDVKFEWDYGAFAGQGSTPFFGVQFQYVDTTLLEPDNKDFLIRCVKVPSVMAWDGVNFSGGFELNESAFSSIKSRAPIAIKQLFMWEFGTFNPGITDMWVDVTYEIVQLNLLQQAQFLVAQ